jgi:hypothetical protein
MLVVNIACAIDTVIAPLMIAIKLLNGFYHLRISRLSPGGVFEREQADVQRLLSLH